ncbi:MAG: hypothetical protein M3R08_08785, partial [Bacteroidota bacterium]|nr:hypothetical protein [Bacteroidota bacterium]
MKSIGGYFVLETGKQISCHPEALALNTGRNALEYIIRAKGYKVIHLPSYTCDVLRAPLERTGVEVRYYSLDQNLDPVIDASVLGRTEALLYTNYFGLRSATAQRLAAECPTLIMDHAQCFYTPPIKGVDTFYSARKFIGVADGSFLYTDKHLDEELEQDLSYDRYAHLLKSVDLGIEAGYAEFHEHEQALNDVPLRRMSGLTARSLATMDHTFIQERRRRNHAYLHNELSGLNELPLEPTSAEVPMIYPYMTDAIDLRQKLLRNKIYVAKYWNDLLAPIEPGGAERHYIDRLICLPIDQRWDLEDMERILK